VVLPPGSHVVNNLIPFSNTGRYQQVYDASLFSPGAILSIAFSPSDTHSILDFFIANLDISFGATSVAVGALSSVLDNNITGPMTNVFSGDVNQTGLALGPDTFSLVFNLTPFFFDPVSGNLLLDITINSLTHITLGVSQISSNPYSSRAWQDNSHFGSNADGGALRTQFDITASPEDIVASLVASAAINQGRGRALTQQLQALQRQLDRGNTATAAGLLNGFTALVNSISTLSSGQAQSLIDAAEALIP